MVGILRDALATTLRLEEPPFLTGAGRTDTGVHAFAQVVSVDLPTPLLGDADADGGAERLRRSVNAQLKGQVYVRSLQQVRADFDARRSARWRAYRYLVVAGERWSLATTDALAWTVAGPLDMEAMNEAASRVLGEHDFRSFCRRPVDKGPEEPLRRHVLAAHWSAVADPLDIVPGAVPVLRFDIRGHSFCHNMVRSLVSALVAVGQGRLSGEEITRRLGEPARAGLPSPAPAPGLCLVGVGYDEVDGGPSGFLD